MMIPKNRGTTIYTEKSPKPIDIEVAQGDDGKWYIYSSGGNTALSGPSNSEDDARKLAIHGVMSGIWKPLRK